MHVKIGRIEPVFIIVKQGQVQNDADQQWVGFEQDLLANLERPQVERLGLVKPPLVMVEPCQMGQIIALTGWLEMTSQFEWVGVADGLGINSDTEARAWRPTRRASRVYHGTLREKDRRRYAAVEAVKLGRGGVECVAGVLECDPKTATPGQAELAASPEAAPAGNRARIKKGRPTAG